MPDAASRPDYTGYFEARGWDRNVSAENFWYYDEMNRHTVIPAGARVLDIGFGDGRFLDWCAHRKMVPAGVEILDAALAKASAFGHDVARGPFTSSTFEPGRIFDVIACFDVIEHLTTEDLRMLLSDTLPHLAQGGRYIFRFPNGNSPFVGPVYNSDVTHLALRTPEAVDGIGRSLGLKVEVAFNDRLLPPGGVQRARRRITYALRSLIESIVCLAYFGARRPLDPNVFVVLGRAS